MELRNLRAFVEVVRQGGFSQAAKAAGASGLRVVTPYYNRPTQDGLCAHYEAIARVVVTNTVPLNEAGKNEHKIKVLSIAGLLGRAVEAIHEETSVSSLFS